MKPINRVIKKMCDIVGADYKMIDTMQDGWYLRHSWTAEQEEEFRVWFERYLYDNADARKAIMKWNRKNKEEIKSTVSSFIFNYGWKGDYGN